MIYWIKWQTRVIGLPVVEAVKGTDFKDYFFLRNFISGFIGNADRLNKPQIFFTVILNRFDKHNTLRQYRRTHLYIISYEY